MAALFLCYNRKENNMGVENMKTCRFCMHEQESGAFCEACGSPFPADKVDFTSGPEDLSAPLMAADPALDPETPAQPAEPAPAEQPPVQDTPLENAPSEEAPAENAPEPEDAQQPQESQPEEEKKIIYSAFERGETVYARSTGKISTNNPAFAAPAVNPQNTQNAQTAGQNTQSGAAKAAPLPVGKSAAERYSTLQKVVTGSYIAQIILLFFCCASNIFSLILIFFANRNMTEVKRGTAFDPEHNATMAKRQLIACWVLHAFSFIVLFIMVLFL